MPGSEKFRFCRNFLWRFTRLGAAEIYGFDGGFLEAGDWLLSVAASLNAGGDFTSDDFSNACHSRSVDSSEAESILTALRIAGVIISRQEGPLAQKPELPWEELGWGMAALFHTAVLHTDFHRGDPEGWQRQTVSSVNISSAGTGPSVIREITSESNPIRLDEPCFNASRQFHEVLLQRRTCRRFDPKRNVSRGDFSTLMHLAARSLGTLRNPYFGDHMLRTTPSGGARHPVEIYPQIFRVEGLPDGNFHYSPLSHEIRRLGEVHDKDIFEMGQRQSGCTQMPLAFLITARFARNIWKYRYAKSYLFTVLDVGHFVLTLVLASESLGLRCFITPALNVEQAIRHLRLGNYFDECPIYLVAVG